MPSLSMTYAQNMPGWMVAKYFDPEAQRCRVAVHDYQQTEIHQMRSMDNCKSVDSLEMPLKCADDVLSAFEHIISSGLSSYLEHFVDPFVGDWPTQLYMHKIAYSDADNSDPYWKDHRHPFHDTLATSLVAFDEYPVENFHSVLRVRTKEGNTGKQISFKGKEIDACKHELHAFKSWFVPSKRFNFSSKRINSLKAKAARFLTNKFQRIITNPGAATVIPRAPRQRKAVTKWQLPDLFDDKVVTNKALPLGFKSLDNPPNSQNYGTNEMDTDDNGSGSKSDD
eukprot:gene20910-22963_t